MNPIEINALDHVVLRVKDLAAALAFYRDALELKGPATDPPMSRV
ncbi:MAG: VOC family protein [Proteobacteria bacterium]|nr:VOC family protein [Pseudomonadota bacterium]